MSSLYRASFGSSCRTPTLSPRGLLAQCISIKPGSPHSRITIITTVTLVTSGLILHLLLLLLRFGLIPRLRILLLLLLRLLMLRLRPRLLILRRRPRLRCSGRARTLTDGDVRRTSSATLSDVRLSSTNLVLPSEGRIIRLDLLVPLAGGDTSFLRLR